MLKSHEANIDLVNGLQSRAIPSSTSEAARLYKGVGSIAQRLCAKASALPPGIALLSSRCSNPNRGEKPVDALEIMVWGGLCSAEHIGENAE
jgi:hypothetical protein